jgi:hypothetical protein
LDRAVKSPRGLASLLPGLPHRLTPAPPTGADADPTFLADADPPSCPDFSLTGIRRLPLLYAGLPIRVHIGPSPGDFTDRPVSSAFDALPGIRIT